MTTAQFAKQAKEVALGLVALGIPVFKVRVSADGTKTPMHERGHLDASVDPGLVSDWFIETPQARVGAWMGGAGLLALDVDVKNGKDGWAEIEESWYEVPATFSYDTPTGGTHLIYTPPAGVDMAPSTNYRGMKGVDIRAGSSWVLWNGDAPKSRDEFAPAPDWVLDATPVKSAEGFSGDVREWYDSLTSGEPNVLVRRAIDRVNDDMGHAEMVSATYEAIRLGAEGNPGVETLIAALEDAWLSRDPGGHTTPEDRWEYKFHEALASGVDKFGAATELRASLPAYDLTTVPASVPSKLLTGESGTKDDFTALLRALLAASEDDLFVTSVLWNCPRTRDLAREWGLDFVFQRVTEAREKPEPIRENPTLPDRSNVEGPKPPEKATVKPVSVGTSHFLTTDERETVESTRTFITDYMKGTNTKGFTNPIYAVPAAWTCLSMAFGRSAFVPLSKTFELNLWFIILGESTTGKGTEDGFMRPVLNLLMAGGDAYYNLGALSSPDGLHLSLLQRDGLASIIHNDEAADFFRDIRGGKEWMTSVPDKLSKWNDGYVEPSSKISLKDFKGKDARTSLNQLMWGTPDRMLELMDASQFQSGYLARVNWVWDTRKPDPNRKSDLKIQPERKHEIPEAAYEIATDLMHARAALKERTGVGASPEAQERLNRAADEFHAYARKSTRYAFFKPAVDRLVMETLWRLASLTALYRGESSFTLTDALVSVYYGSQWLETMMQVAESISESPYSRDVEMIENYIKTAGGSVTEAKLLHEFRGLIVRSKRELTDRIEFLQDSGRILRRERDQVVTYAINGG